MKKRTSLLVFLLYLASISCVCDSKPRSRSIHLLTAYTLLKESIPRNHSSDHTTLDYAYTHFQKVPGFLKTLKSLTKIVHNLKEIKGHMFELAVAKKIHEKTINQKTASILGFNQTIQMPHDPEIKRQIDIHATINGTNTWIECKNTNWKHWKKYKKQLKEQKKIVEQMSNEKKRSLQYIVYSKQKIPDHLINWFQKNNITAVKDE